MRKLLQYIVGVTGLCLVAAGCSASTTTTPAAPVHVTAPSLPPTVFKPLTAWATDPDYWDSSQAYVQVRIVSVNGSCYIETDDPGGDNGITNATFSPARCPLTPAKPG